MMRIARYVLTALLLVFIVFIYVGESTPSASIEEVQQTFEAQAQAQDQENAAAQAEDPEAEVPESLLANMTLQDERNCERYLYIESSYYEGMLYWKSDYGMVADELFIARATDEDAVTHIQSCIEQRVADQKEVFDGYAPDQAANVAAYTFETRGLYVFYAVGDRSAKWKQVFDGIQ